MSNVRRRIRIRRRTVRWRSLRSWPGVLTVRCRRARLRDVQRSSRSGRHHHGDSRRQEDCRVVRPGWPVSSSGSRRRHVHASRRDARLRAVTRDVMAGDEARAGAWSSRCCRSKRSRRVGDDQQAGRDDRSSARGEEHAASGEPPPLRSGTGASGSRRTSRQRQRQQRRRVAVRAAARRSATTGRASARSTTAASGSARQLGAGMRGRSRSPATRAPKPRLQRRAVRRRRSAARCEFRGLRNRPVFFAGYQRTAITTRSTQSALMPTVRERAGDFSGAGRRFAIPQTGRAVPRQRRFPRSRSARRPRRCSRYYPAAECRCGRPVQLSDAASSATSAGQRPVAREARASTTADSVFGTARISARTTEAVERVRVRRRQRRRRASTPRSTGRTASRSSSRCASRYQFTRQTNGATPYFANRTNVSGDAGITGNNQDPVNWGPPAWFRRAASPGSATRSRRRHGTRRTRARPKRSGEPRPPQRHVRRRRPAAAVDILAQQDPRGTLQFTGAATGSDFADFLLGLPHQRRIAFGNADK